MAGSLTSLGPPDGAPSKRHLWSEINFDDFRTSSCLPVLSYVWLLWLILVGIVVFAADVFTAVNLLAFDRFSSAVKPSIPFKVSKWIFSVSILISVALIVLEWVIAVRVLRKKRIADSYLDPCAFKLQCTRDSLGWRRFLVFSKLTESKKGVDYVAMFVYFQFKGCVRFLAGKSPRQVVNVVTIWSVMKAELLPKEKLSGLSSLLRLFENIKTLSRNGDTLQVVIYFTMMFTLIIWAIDLVCLLIAFLMYITYMLHRIPQADKTLSKYCRRKIDSRVASIAEARARKIAEKEAAKEAARRRKEELRADRKMLSKPSSIRTFSTVTTAATTVVDDSDKPDLADLPDLPALPEKYQKEFGLSSPDPKEAKMYDMGSPDSLGRQHTPPMALSGAAMRPFGHDQWIGQQSHQQQQQPVNQNDRYYYYKGLNSSNYPFPDQAQYGQHQAAAPFDLSSQHRQQAHHHQGFTGGRPQTANGQFPGPPYPTFSHGSPPPPAYTVAPQRMYTPQITASHQPKQGPPPLRSHTAPIGTSQHNFSRPLPPSSLEPGRQQPRPRPTGQPGGASTPNSLSVQAEPSSYDLSDILAENSKEVSVTATPKGGRYTLSEPTEFGMGDLADGTSAFSGNNLFLDSQPFPRSHTADHTTGRYEQAAAAQAALARSHTAAPSFEVAPAPAVPPNAAVGHGRVGSEHGWNEEDGYTSRYSLDAHPHLDQSTFQISTDFSELTHSNDRTYEYVSSEDASHFLPQPPRDGGGRPAGPGRRSSTYAPSSHSSAAGHALGHSHHDHPLPLLVNWEVTGHSAFQPAPAYTPRQFDPPPRSATAPVGVDGPSPPLPPAPAQPWPGNPAGRPHPGQQPRWG